MENHDLLPFERNRYYHGKLLTSADFLAEQSYHNNKRRFLNGLVYGMGILCGLGVQSLDDLTLMIESGVAVDGFGREMVVEHSTVKKLSTVEGFESLSTGKVVLALRYREEAVHPTYAVNRQPGGEEYELNRIREGWELFVANKAGLPLGAGVETDFFSTGTLYEDDDFLIEASMPAAVSCGMEVRIAVRALRKSPAAHVLSLDCMLQVPAFTTEDGTHEQNIRLSEVILAQGEVAETFCWLRAAEQAAGESVIIAKPHNIHVSIDGTEKKQEDSFLLKVNLLGESVDDIVSREVGRISLEAMEMGGRAYFVPLAELDLRVDQSSYVIDSVSDREIKRYLPMASQYEMRRDYSACFRSPQKTASPQGPSLDGCVAPNGVPPESQLKFATGMCEIPLGAKPRRGDVFHSDEIMHGLGEGNIHIQTGFEYITDDVKLNNAAKNTIIGDADLFENEKPPVPMARTAVKVMNDRGSFVVALKLMRDTPYAVALVRWMAVKLAGDGENNLSVRIAGKSISAVQPTVLLATRESHYFDVRFKNMEPTSLSYELTENDSGEITTDGVYTAPGREGVYEVRIYCTDLPLISTYAYAIVKKRDLDAEEAAGRDKKPVENVLEKLKL